MSIDIHEVLTRFPDREVDWDGPVPVGTSAVRGWEKLPVVVG